MLPLIPIVLWSLIAGGGAGLYWYNSLDERRKREANRLAIGYAREVFDKGLDELTQSEADHIRQYVQRRLSS